MSLKILATLLARGGSKGVPLKNIRPLQGKPLIAHTIETARNANIFSAIAVSSDSDQILKTAADSGVGLLVKRPDDLASDTAAKIPGIRQCAIKVEELTGEKFDLVIDLDVSCPLTSKVDIGEVQAMLLNELVSNVVSASVSKKSPYFNIVEFDESGGLKLSKPSPEASVVRRQDAPTCYALNGAVYGWKRELLMSSDVLLHSGTALYIMPDYRSIDIDTELDFLFVEKLLTL